MPENGLETAPNEEMTECEGEAIVEIRPGDLVWRPRDNGTGGRHT